MQRLEVSGAVRHIYIYIYIYMSLGVKGLMFKIFQNLTTTMLKRPMFWNVTSCLWCVIPDVSYDRSAFIFKGQANEWTLEYEFKVMLEKRGEPLKRTHCFSPEHLNPHHSFCICYIHSSLPPYKKDHVSFALKMKHEFTV
jgi:hypothetical protein